LENIALHVNVLDTKSLNVIAANARIVKEKTPNTQVKHCFYKTLCFCALVSLSSNALANSACDANDSLTIYSATDDGTYEETHGPENTIDANFDPESRWSNESQGSPKFLLLDLGAQQTLKSLGIAWYKGDSRKSSFFIETSLDGTDYHVVRQQGQSGGSTLELESYEFETVKAQYVRIVGNGNESNDWNSIVEVAAYGCGEPVEKPATPILTERKGEGLFGLRVDRSPGENFDLSGWYITTPAWWHGVSLYTSGS